MEYWSLEQAKLGKEPEKPLAGQVALITGAAGAIGTATARALGGAGAELALLDLDANRARACATEIGGDGTKVSIAPSLIWETVLRPSILNVYQVAPERLELNALYDNIRVLTTNAQKTSRFEIAFWNKVFYPAAVLVMMMLALPFAHFQRRQGGVGFRIFAGTMLGLTFFLLGRLFSNLGLLNDWPPLFSAAFPLVVFVTVAASMLWWIERR